MADVDVAIVGTGFSGLGMGVALQRAGIQSFRIFEKGSDVGGTWRENTYPGAACDVPSHLYSFSFELNTNWTRSFSPQGEILEYLRHVADKYELRPHIRFGTAVQNARYDELERQWVISTSDGTVTRSRLLVLGNGALHVPSLPEIEGRDSFQGTSFHSAAWRHDVDLEGKRVACIGTGASAIQFVPEVAKVASSLDVYQRSAAWIMPRPDRAYSGLEQVAFQLSPTLQRAYRYFLYWWFESRALGFVVEPKILELGERIAKSFLARQVKNPELRRALTPSYRMGCKRILMSNDFYPAMTRPNVHLVTDPIARIEPKGVRTRDGVLREVDVILYGTGFNVAEYAAHLHVVGKGGVELNAQWNSSPEAYLGITVANFPNLFLMMGPNTGLGHNSMVFMIEAQARYVVDCLKQMRERGARAMEVEPAAQRRFADEVQAKLGKGVWASGCKSWYLGPDGRNPTLWPSFTFDYWRQTRHVDVRDYRLMA
jgi:cation diffusion facilitator CzcD-associated flavoprotein CzcO